MGETEVCSYGQWGGVLGEFSPFVFCFGYCTQQDHGWKQQGEWAGGAYDPDFEGNHPAWTDEGSGDVLEQPSPAGPCYAPLHLQSYDRPTSVLHHHWPDSVAAKPSSPAAAHLTEDTDPSSGGGVLRRILRPRLGSAASGGGTNHGNGAEDPCLDKAEGEGLGASHDVFPPLSGTAGY